MENKDNEEAKEYTSPLRDATVQLHEMYVELCKSGFSRKESLTIISKVVVASMAYGPDDFHE